MRADFAPELAVAPPRAVRKVAVRDSLTSSPFESTGGAAYESGAHTKRTLAWRAATLTANQAILPNLTTIRDRSRAAARNHGYAKGAIDRLVANIIGTGIKPQSEVQDDALREQIHRLWLRWTDEADADGLLDWYGLQALAVREWMEAGEVFVRLRIRRKEDGLSVPLQVQLIEPELCPHDYNGIAPNGQRVRAGIEIDAIGRRRGYWFYRSRPGDLVEVDYGRRVRVDAEQIIHLYEPLRAGQLRGHPQLAQALVKLYELDKYDDATLLRQQIANLFVGFLKRASVPSGETAYNPLTNEEVSSADPPPIVGLQPGMFQELYPGEDVTWSNPPGVNETYDEFMRQQLMGAATAVGVPYEVLTGDMRDLNDRVIRVALQEFRRRIQQWQHQIVAYQLCRRVWLAWFERAFLSGALPLPLDFIANPAPYTAVKWMPQGWPYLHPLQDVHAAKEAIRSGLTSRSAEVSARGEDAEVIDREQATDNARADGLGLRYDSDGRQATSGRTRAAATPDPDAAGDSAASSQEAA